MGAVPCPVMFPFDSHTSRMRYKMLLLFLLQMGKQGTERLANLPKVTQLVNEVIKTS